VVPSLALIPLVPGHPSEEVNVSPILDPMEHAPVEMRQVIEHGTSRLSEEFSGQFEPETVQRVVSECYTSLREAKATNFLPLFLERFTRQRLKAVPDAAGQDLDGVRKIRGDIGERVRTLLAGLGVRQAS
jgi:Protein-tyrosine-phosphatase-like, N-terminal domain